MPEDVARDTTEEPFAETSASIGSEYEHIRAPLGGLLKNRYACVVFI